MTKEIKSFLRERNRAFRVGDKAMYSIARANLKRGIKEAKLAYKKKIEDYFNGNNAREGWRGIQYLTQHRGTKKMEGNSSASLVEELNRFFTRFEVVLPNQDIGCPLGPGNCTFTIQEYEVRQAFKAINARKSSGPDGIPGRVVKACADQLAGVFAKIFNRSLSSAVVPACLKSATIIPIPKKSTVGSLDNYRPIALTSVLMKCFERLVLKYIKTRLPGSLDPYQFAYRANRSTEDAIALALHGALGHLEHSGNYIRMLFIDYSSAFNTIIPDRLFEKMQKLDLPPFICFWIRDFLVHRSQVVKLDKFVSSKREISTGAPQGCVLSPFLYALYTYDCTPYYETNSIVKFADDTTVIGCITGDDEEQYRREVDRIVEWCTANNLILNTGKTKELIVDFRRNRPEPAPLFIKGVCVERVSTFKFLGTCISENLSWTINVKAIIKKSQQRLYFLRLLRKNGLGRKVLETFYRSAIESILTYCILVWYPSCTQADKNALKRVVRTAQKIVGCELVSLDEIYETRCLCRSGKIVRDPTHPGCHLFELLPSGRRFRVIKTRTKRFKESFFPRAVKAINAGMK